MSLLNDVTANLAQYPMEKLNLIKEDLRTKGQTIYDFGTGDPQIPTWGEIPNTLIKAVPEISQYPSIRGSKELVEACRGYLKRRHYIADPTLSILPTRGSKEGVFHIAQSLVGRDSGKRDTIVYPVPGYPVYESSTLFAGGQPHPVVLTPDNNYRFEPWKISKDVLERTAAIWVNYPHNPTGATVDRAYWKQLVEWAHAEDIIILSDDCYVDIYDEQGDDERPLTPLSITSDRVIAFFSLSKRSGMTGYRSGFMAGDPNILEPHAKARANFGLGQVAMIGEASITAWNDDDHVAARRKIFSERLNVAKACFDEMGIKHADPKTTFYLWAKVPEKFESDQIFSLELAKKGVITIPSSWLCRDVTGYFRLAMVPSLEDTTAAMKIIKEFIS